MVCGKKNTVLLLRDNRRLTHQYYINTSASVGRYLFVLGVKRLDDDSGMIRKESGPKVLSIHDLGTNG